MSRLLGPPSETISSVSERASAMAEEMMPGAAGSTLPAARPATDFRKSRRFIKCSHRHTTDRNIDRKLRAKPGHVLSHLFPYHRQQDASRSAKSIAYKEPDFAHLLSR